jgi:hypothetical protein
VDIYKVQELLGHRHTRGSRDTVVAVLHQDDTREV